MPEKRYISSHTGEQIDTAVTKALNPSTTFNSEDAGKLADAKAVGELVNTEKERAEATYLPYDGYSQLARVGEADVADNLTPHSSDSGTSQSVPFILQGSGCANGEEQADTGSYCQLQRKNGNTVTVNQNIKTSVTSFSGTSKGLSFSRDSEGIVTVTGTIENSTVSDRPTFSLAPLANNPIALANHKYLFKKIMLKNNNTTANNIKYGGIVNSTWDMDIGCTFASRIISPSSNIESNLRLTYIVDDNSTAWDRFHNGDVIDEKFKLILIDLTLWFGSNDKIPTHLLNHPEDFFRYYQGSLAYNAGTLTDCNGRYLKTTGRNVWDEEAEAGAYYIYAENGTGQKQGAAGYNRCKNFIQIAPNTVYNMYRAGNIHSAIIGFYDREYNWLGYSTNATANDTYPRFRTPSNAKYMVFYAEGSIEHFTISLYYEGESGYDQYYPYEELANIDTGNEPLLAFDWKEPNGTWHKDTGKTVINGTEEWETYEIEGVQWFFAPVLTGIKETNLVQWGITSKYTEVRGISASSQLKNYTEDKIASSQRGTTNVFNRIWIKDTSFATLEDFKASLVANPITVEYELETPTTEQGTPFAENVAIDDFGTMAFDCPNGVPQGNLIFYPVDYKAEIDTLHNVTDGDMHKIALKGDLADGDPDTIKGVVDYTSAVLSGCGGTLRQVLCLKETLDFDNTNYADLGSLNWSAGSTNQTGIVRWIGSLADAKNSGKCICSNYKSVTATNTYECVDGCALNSNGNQVTIYDSNYNTTADITDFVASLKGQVIAYEKATT